MKKFIPYFFYALIVIHTISACNFGAHDLPSLKESFSKNDKIPFGAFVAFKQLQQLYPNNTININKNKFSNDFITTEDSASLYINISKNFFLSKNDLGALLDFVSLGNSALICSEHIDTTLLDTIGLYQNKDIKDPANYFSEMQTSTVQLDQTIYTDSTRYGYYYYPLNHFFSNKNGGTQYILGITKDAKPNFVVAKFGRGRIYLHSEPRAFSNYFLLQKNNYNYFKEVFAYLPPNPNYVYWDDYYNKRNFAPSDSNGKSGLAVLLQYPALAWALWLVIAGLLLYILFGGKRRQRILRPIPANTNTSLAFTETVGRLYLQKKDNRNIADKIITYFMEYIRQHYFLNTTVLNDAFINALSRKTNVSKAETQQLINLITTLQQLNKIDDQQIVSLNQQIEKFYKPT